jgi:hypothetical protein
MVNIFPSPQGKKLTKTAVDIMEALGCEKLNYTPRGDVLKAKNSTAGLLGIFFTRGTGGGAHKKPLKL